MIWYCVATMIKRTRLEFRGHLVEHVCIHVRMDCPVRTSVISCGDQHGITLGDSNAQKVSR